MRHDRRSVFKACNGIELLEGRRLYSVDVPTSADVPTDELPVDVIAVDLTETPVDTGGVDTGAGDVGAGDDPIRIDPNIYFNTLPAELPDDAQTFFVDTTTDDTATDDTATGEADATGDAGTSEVGTGEVDETTDVPESGEPDIYYTMWLPGSLPDGAVAKDDTTEDVALPADGETDIYTIDPIIDTTAEDGTEIPLDQLPVGYNYRDLPVVIDAEPVTVDPAAVDPVLGDPADVEPVDEGSVHTCDEPPPAIPITVEPQVQLDVAVLGDVPVCILTVQQDAETPATPAIEDASAVPTTESAEPSVSSQTVVAHADNRDAAPAVTGKSVFSDVFASGTDEDNATIDALL